MRKLVLFFLSLPLCAANYYIDNTCSAHNGNGTVQSPCASTNGGAGPFNSVSNAASKTGGYAADDFILGQCGQIYRDSFSAPATFSGTAGHPITLGSYGTCTASNKPILTGANDYSAGATYKWTLCAGCKANTYYLEAAAGGTPGITQPTYTWIDRLNAPTGTGATTLDDRQSYWALDPGSVFSTLYIRDSRGNPGTTSALIEGSKRNTAISASGKSYVVMDGWVIGQTASNAFQLTTSGTGWVVQNSTCWGTAVCWYASSISDFTLLRSITRDIVGNADAVQILGASAGTLTVDHCLFSHGVGNGMRISTGTAATITNVTMVGLTGTNILNAGSTPITVSNSNLMASGSYAMNNSSTGSITYSYSNLLPNWSNGSQLCNNCTDGGHNSYVDPNIKHSRRAGLLTLSTDDIGSLSWFVGSYSAYANSLGLKTCFAIQYTFSSSFIPPASWTTLQGYVAAGNEVVCHTRSHSDMSNSAAFTVHYTGAGTTATMDLNVAGHYFKTTVNGSTDINFDLSTARYTADSSMANLVADINGHAGYTAVLTQYDDYTIWSELSDVAGQDIKTSTYSVLFDETVPGGRRYVGEFDTCISDIQANIPGFTVRSLAWPIDRYNTAAYQSALASGRFTGARLSTGDILLSSIRDYTLYATDTSSIDTTSATTIKRGIWSKMDYLSTNGGTMNLLFAAGLSSAQYQAAFDAVKSYSGNVRVVTLGDAIGHIKNTITGFLPTGVDADGTGIRWTRVWTTDNSNYHLTGSSSLINAGAATTFTTDIEGKPIVGAPDIGAYEFQGGSIKHRVIQ